MSSFSDKNSREDSKASDRSVSPNYGHAGYITVESLPFAPVHNDPLNNWVSLGILIIAIISGYSAYNMLSEPESVLIKYPDGGAISDKSRRNKPNALIPDSSLPEQHLLNLEKREELPLKKAHK